MIWFNSINKKLSSLKLQNKAQVLELDQKLSEYIMGNAKSKIEMQGKTMETSSATKKRAREELDNLHDFAALFGIKAT